MRRMIVRTPAQQARQAARLEPEPVAPEPPLPRGPTPITVPPGRYRQLLSFHWWGGDCSFDAVTKPELLDEGIAGSLFATPIRCPEARATFDAWLAEHGDVDRCRLCWHTVREHMEAGARCPA